MQKTFIAICTLMASGPSAAAIALAFLASGPGAAAVSRRLGHTLATPKVRAAPIHAHALMPTLTPMPLHFEQSQNITPVSAPERTLGGDSGNGHGHHNPGEQLCQDVEGYCLPYANEYQDMCGDLFCEDCPYAHKCDESCGIGHCAPTSVPTSAPTGNPSGAPTLAPSGAPSGNPTGAPTGSPTQEPTGAPTDNPSASPSANPTAIPSGHPSSMPVSKPTPEPSSAPTGHPSLAPSSAPSSIPSGEPTALPTTVCSMELEQEKQMNEKQVAKNKNLTNELVEVKRALNEFKCDEDNDTDDFVVDPTDEDGNDDDREEDDHEEKDKNKKSAASMGYLAFAGLFSTAVCTVAIQKVRSVRSSDNEETDFSLPDGSEEIQLNSSMQGTQPASAGDAASEL